jgi:hypothetical protein
MMLGQGHLASTRPAPMAASGPGLAASPVVEVTVVTSLAESTSTTLTRGGESDDTRYLVTRRGSAAN